MGIYRVTSGAVGKALPIGVGNNTISGPSAWLFENQSGTLGTNLNGSLIYSGAGGDIRAILSGVIGIQNKVTALNLDATFTGANPFYAGFAAGSGYYDGNAIDTTDVTTVPNSPATVPAGLTVNIINPGTERKLLSKTRAKNDQRRIFLYKCKSEIISNVSYRN